MGKFPLNAFEVRVRWASHHQWPAGYGQDSPSSSYALWLMLEGEAKIRSEDQSWYLSAGQAFLWPKDKPRHVSTQEGASWLSLGISVDTATQSDFLRLLPLPALQRLEIQERQLLQSWLETILQLRYGLTQTTPENRKAAQYFESLHMLPLQLSYTKWLGQLVAERPAYLNEMESGLAHTIVAWCWGQWGTTDLAEALHQQSPIWLQNTLERMRESPETLIGELARAAGFSPAQFRRSFHQRMGQSPSDYLQSQRLDKARLLLEETDLNIGEIAAKTGFSSVPHFVRLWKVKTGLPPLQYRIALKNANL